MAGNYDLPFKVIPEARRCTAPSHFSEPNSRFCIDIYLPVGSPIMAIESGIVVDTESRYNKSYASMELGGRRANYIEIEHGDRRTSLYAHLAWHSVRVKIGDRVKKGQLIALSGQTGYTTYPHLHFGLFDVEYKNIPAEFIEPLPSKRDYRRFEK